jgi:hypothetical protein
MSVRSDNDDPSASRDVRLSHRLGAGDRECEELARWVEPRSLCVESVWLRRVGGILREVIRSASRVENEEAA